MKKGIITLIIISCLSCASQNNCSDIGTSYASYKEVMSMINTTSFTLEDDVNTSKSSWITKANYYSCDEITGYFVLQKGSSSYVFKDVPISVWNEFKTADSFGKYYHTNIKDKYNLFQN